MPSVRIALANIPPATSPKDSVVRVENAIADAGRAGAGIVAFPEGYVPGYRTAGRPAPPPDASFLDDSWRRVAHAANRAGVAVVLGTERIVDGRPRLTALVTDADGSTLGFQDKVQLDPSEGPTYASGDERHVFSVAGLTFGV